MGRTGLIIVSVLALIQNFCTNLSDLCRIRQSTIDGTIIWPTRRLDGSGVLLLHVGYVDLTFVFVCVFIDCKSNFPCAYIWTNLCCNSISIYNLMCSVTQSHMRFLVLSATLRAIWVIASSYGYQVLLFVHLHLHLCFFVSFGAIRWTRSLRSTVHAIAIVHA